MAVGVSALRADTIPTVTHVEFHNAVVRTEFEALPTAMLGEKRLLAYTDSIPVSVAISVTAPVAGESFWSWLMANIPGLLAFALFLGEVIVRFTPTEKDNANLLWLKNLFTLFFGNRKVGGGHFV